jgi:hypothetical protein
LTTYLKAFLLAGSVNIGVCTRLNNQTGNIPLGLTELSDLVRLVYFSEASRVAIDCYPHFNFCFGSLIYQSCVGYLVALVEDGSQ